MTPRNKKENAKPIIARMAFNRAQGLASEVESKILKGVENLLVRGDNMSHEEVCDAFVQNLFVSNIACTASLLRSISICTYHFLIFN